MAAMSSAAVAPTGLVRNRWLQLGLGLVGMIFIANLQYAWTLFVKPIDEQMGWGTPAIQVAYSIFILLETWLVPFEGYLVDRFGPGRLVFVGGILAGLSWVLNGAATSLWMLYLGMIIGGIGAGIVYGTAIGNALKWFPDRRGLAAGLTAAGFGAGSALTIIPIANMISSNGYQATFMTFGLIQGGVVILTSFFLAAPRRDEVPAFVSKARQAVRDFQPLDMLKQPVFWAMFVVMTFVGVGGNMATAQLGPIATDFKVDKIPVSLVGITLPALTFALSLDRIMNGLTRPVTGWVSDRVGREPTMTVMFGIQAITILLLISTAGNPVLFVVFSGLAFFSYGEIFSLFPAMSGDLFGRTYATTNYGLLYMSKGVAALLVPIGSVLQLWTGSWMPIFIVAIVLNAIASLVCATALPRMARAHCARAALEPEGAPALVPAVAGGSH
ncbi:MAG: oxalate/formate MFS antiporter [Chloroflexi bacterium]|nr:oxalate/formate MFS antiporter [Chloroflexota bacterium]MBV9545143.1 oxalate/formate MFS antiporter [Chloroflexota bacterium]